MRNAVGAALVAILLALAVPATAQDIEAGTEAYQRGDYAAALDKNLSQSDWDGYESRQAASTISVNLGAFSTVSIIACMEGSF